MKKTQKKLIEVQGYFDGHAPPMPPKKRSLPGQPVTQSGWQTSLICRADATNCLGARLTAFQTQRGVKIGLSQEVKNLRQIYSY